MRLGFAGDAELGQGELQEYKTIRRADLKLRRESQAYRIQHSWECCTSATTNGQCPLQAQAQAQATSNDDDAVQRTGHSWPRYPLAGAFKFNFKLKFKPESYLLGSFSGASWMAPSLS